MSKQYYFENNEFVIKDYNRKKSFASFLPGIAGLKGKPMWAFYVNRAQCMSAFGIKDKEGAIMEFQPANVAYRRTAAEGFRTFIKYEQKGKKHLHEPFTLCPENRSEQTLYITPHEFRITDISKAHGLMTEVLYYTVAQESFPALVRKVTITNISRSKKKIELIVRHLILILP